MSVWASFKRSATKASDDDAPNASRPRTSFGTGAFGAGSESVDKRAGFSASFNASPFDDDSTEQKPSRTKAETTSSSCAPLFDAMQMGEPAPAQDIPLLLDSEHHDYIRDNCIVPREQLTTFANIIVDESIVNFAEHYQPIARGAVRPVSGLLLFGPPGTGKTSTAQAIAHYLHGTFYTFSSADLPNGKAGAQRIDALFDVATTGKV